LEAQNIHLADFAFSSFLLEVTKTSIFYESFSRLPKAWWSGNGLIGCEEMTMQHIVSSPTALFM